MNRTDRLFAITTLLHSRGRLPARELAAHFEVSQRTIYRDISALSESGVPIVALPGQGYALAEGYFLPPVRLTPTEASALVLGARLLATAASPALASAANSARIGRRRSDLREESAMDDAVYEIVLFEVRPDVARERYLEASTRATDWLRTQPGFLSREILEDESGQWLELLRWATLEDALAAASAIEETEHVAAIMDTVVPESIRMLHPTRVAAFLAR